MTFLKTIIMIINAMYFLACGITTKDVSTVKKMYHGFWK